MIIVPIAGEVVCVTQGSRGAGSEREIFSRYVGQLRKTEVVLSVETKL